MTTDSILAAIDPDETIATLQQLVKAPSDYPPGDTRQVVEVCTQKLAAEGLDFEVLAPEEHVPSLIATLPGQGTGPTLVMHSHLDTVPAYDREDWTRDPWSGDLSEGRVHGRGTVDDKGCAAAQLMAFVALGVVALLVAVALKINESGPNSHGLELPSREAAALAGCPRSGAPSSRATRSSRSPPHAWRTPAYPLRS